MRRTYPVNYEFPPHVSAERMHHILTHGRLPRRRHNWLLHLVLTIMTGGIWGLVWFVLRMLNGGRR